MASYIPMSGQLRVPFGCRAAPRSPKRAVNSKVVLGSRKEVKAGNQRQWVGVGRRSHLRAVVGRGRLFARCRCLPWAVGGFLPSAHGSVMPSRGVGVRCSGNWLSGSVWFLGGIEGLPRNNGSNVVSDQGMGRRSGADRKISQKKQCAGVEGWFVRELQAVWPCVLRCCVLGCAQQNNACWRDGSWHGAEKRIWNC